MFDYIPFEEMIYERFYVFQTLTTATRSLNFLSPFQLILRGYTVIYN